MRNAGSGLNRFLRFWRFDLDKFRIGILGFDFVWEDIVCNYDIDVRKRTENALFWNVDFLVVNEEDAFLGVFDHRLAEFVVAVVFKDFTIVGDAPCCKEG